MLEAAQNGDNCFATLTYDDENLPPDNSVDPRAVQNFLKRLRKRLDTANGLRIRYFAVGEYGDTTSRPHYHLALFNLPGCYRGRTDHTREDCCPACDLVKHSWGRGAVDLAPLEIGSAAYIAGYVVKKMTKHDDPRLEGRWPEFALMSRKPGLGLAMMDDLASVLLEHNLDETLEDVPTTLAHGTAQYPLGRYLRGKLRQRIGRSEKTPETVLQKIEAEMQPMREAAFNNSTSFADEITKENYGRRTRIYAKQKLRKRKVNL